MVKFSKH